MIERLLRLVGRWARKPVNHTSWVAVVTPTDRPKSVRNRFLIELFCGVVCVVTLPFWHFCWCRGFCHRTESDLFLFLFKSLNRISKLKAAEIHMHHQQTTSQDFLPPIYDVVSTDYDVSCRFSLERFIKQFYAIVSCIIIIPYFPIMHNDSKLYLFIIVPF